MAHVEALEALRQMPGCDAHVEVFCHRPTMHATGMSTYLLRIRVDVGSGNGASGTVRVRTIAESHVPSEIANDDTSYVHIAI